MTTPGGAAHSGDTRTLEEALAAGEVLSALLLKGERTESEREIARQAWEAGLAQGRAGVQQQPPGDLIPGADPGACPDCGEWRKAGIPHVCVEQQPPGETETAGLPGAEVGSPVSALSVSPGGGADTSTLIERLNELIALGDDRGWVEVRLSLLREAAAALAAAASPAAPPDEARLLREHIDALAVTLAEAEAALADAQQALADCANANPWTHASEIAEKACERLGIDAAALAGSSDERQAT